MSHLSQLLSRINLKREPNYSLGTLSNCGPFLRVISDGDDRFTRTFWTELFKLLGSNLNISSSYNSEIEEKTERFNSMLEEFLSHFIDAQQRNWVQCSMLPSLASIVNKSHQRENPLQNSLWQTTTHALYH